METLLKNIRNTSRILLENNEVEAVLGFCRGSLPMARRPFLARTPEQTEQLYWDEFCLMNLANFIPADVQGKIAVIAKGCDWRNLVVHGQEGLLSLEEKIFVLGVSCKGMLDAVKIQGASDKLERIEGIASAADELKILTPDGEFSLARKTLYRQACLECRQPAPVTADIWLTETAGEIQSLQDLADRDFDQADELNYGKEQYQEMFKNCLMCFACRDSCPLCYCKQCFVDIEKSHWISWEAP
ncbi:MAG TPA: hypothetical protein VJ969_11755, partial [Desulfopila sp.]|nr:hypothetical protein [Desulfopila sp.]